MSSPTAGQLFVTPPFDAEERAFTEMLESFRQLFPDLSLVPVMPLRTLFILGKEQGNKAAMEMANQVAKELARKMLDEDHDELMRNPVQLHKLLHETAREYLDSLANASGGDVEQAAKLAGVSSATAYRYMNEYGHRE